MAATVDPRSPQKMLPDPIHGSSTRVRELVGGSIRLSTLFQSNSLPLLGSCFKVKLMRKCGDSGRGGSGKSSAGTLRALPNRCSGTAFAVILGDVDEPGIPICPDSVEIGNVYALRKLRATEAARQSAS